jgi:lysophospholipase L1-like esterase
MTRCRSVALLAGLVGVVALVCATIFAAFGVLAGGPGRGLNQASGTGGVPGPGTGPDAGRAAPASEEAWTGTWAAAPAGAEPDAPDGYPGRSLRNVVHTSIGGTRARITLSNRYSPRALRIGHASIAVSTGAGATAVPGTMRPLTFGRQSTAAVPPGRQITSDPVRLKVPADSDLLVTLYTPGPGGPVTYHPAALQTSYLARGDRTEDVGGTAYTRRTAVWRYLTAVDVVDRQARGAIVAFGDSITDGVGSRRDADHRWPDVLADRLRGRRYGVLNEGLGGNQVLRDGVRSGAGAGGVARFGSDVLDRAGVRVVVVDLGINDILRGHQRDPARITAGLRDLTRQAHARGLRVVGSTLTPFGRSVRYNATTESVRDRVNDEIRAGGIFDAVVDFDRALRDPYAPDRLAPVYDSGDGLHPSDAGYRAMGEYLSLRVLADRSPARL